jgi:hypothetical protein
MLTDSVIRKANQLSANLRYQGEDKAAESITVHMRTYWPPTERLELYRLIDEQDPRLDPIAVAAGGQLRAEQAP